MRPGQDSDRDIQAKFERIKKQALIVDTVPQKSQFRGIDHCRRTAHVDIKSGQVREVIDHGLVNKSRKFITIG